MNKLTITRVALGSLQRRRGQYKAMILSAGLAIFFVSSLFLAVQSVFETYRQSHIQSRGSQDAILRDAENALPDLRRGDVSPQALLDNGLVGEVGTVYVIGEVEDTNCAIGYYDEAGAKLAGRTLLEGRMPEAAGEIAVEPNFLQKLRAEATVGGHIELPLRIPIGVRTDFLPDPALKTYRIVGILRPMSEKLAGSYHTDWEYLHYPSAIVSDQEQVELGGRAIEHRLVTFAREVSWDQFAKYATETLNMTAPLDTQFSLFGGSFDMDKNFGQIMVIIASMLGSVLVLSACLGIVNAFSGSLTQRRTQIGMMRAVGATSRQIRQLFGREAMLLAILIAPVAIALSFAFVFLLTRFIGSLTFHWTPWFLALDFVASLACVGLAAWVPLLSASRIPPMQAIREVSLLRAKRRVRVRQRKAFDAPRLIAGRFIRLYRTRQAGIAVMVALSMLMITAAVPFIANMWTKPVTHGYQIIGSHRFMDAFAEQNVRPHEGLTDADIAEIAAMPLVSGVDTSAQAQINLLLDEVTPYAADTWGTDYWTDAPRDEDGQYAAQYYEAFKSQLKLSQEALPCEIHTAESSILESLKPYVLEGEIDIDALNAGREVLMCASEVYYKQQITTPEGDTYARMLTDPPTDGTDYQTYTNDSFHAGDALSILRLFTRGIMKQDGDGNWDYITDMEREDAATTIGAVIGLDGIYALNELGVYVSDCRLVTTNAGLAALGIEPAGYINAGVRLSGAPDDATHRYLTDELTGIAARGTQMTLLNRVQEERDSSLWMTVFKASLLAVALLLLSMCVSLVNNAVTGRVRSDKRSIGTLRAVGAQMSDIVRSYRLQALAMILWGVVFGLVLGVAYTLVNRLLSDVFPDNLYPVRHLGLILLGQAAFLGGVALLCGINLSLRVREITRASIVSNIREL